MLLEGNEPVDEVRKEARTSQDYGRGAKEYRVRIEGAIQDETGKE